MTKLKIAAVNVAQLLLVLALAVPYFAVGTLSDAVWLVLLAAAGYALAAYAVGHLANLARRRARLGRVVRGRRMAPEEYAADQRQRRAARVDAPGGAA